MRKSQAIGTRIGSELFDFGSRSKTLFVDHSQLKSAGLDAFGQLYGDEGTQGFVMVSHRTGSEVPFELDFTNREADGSTVAWRFKPGPHAVAMDSRLVGVSAIVFNT